MLGTISRMIASMLPGALFLDSLCGRAHRCGWKIEKCFDLLLGQGHCAGQFKWEDRVRKLEP